MIMTVTLNPAIDKTVEIDNFKVGTVNRISSMRLDAGGKGINVSKIVKLLGGRSKAFGILAGNNGQYIKNYMDSCGIENDFVFVDGETRTNIKVIDKLKSTNTDINESGPDTTAEEMELLEEKIFSMADGDTILVFSGSTPSSVPADIYKRMILKAKNYGIRSIMDCDGELLRQGIEAGPYLIKPNIYELEKLTGRSLPNMEEIIDAAKGIQKYGVDIVVVSHGEKGALFIDREDIIHAEGLKVDVKSTVGAGDSMVAALAYALDLNYPFEKAVVLAAASAAAKVTTSGSQPPELQDIFNYEKQIILRYIRT